MIGFEAELPEAGSYLATEIGQSPVILVRTKSGAIVGFHNSCRHRGAQICVAGHGRAPRLVCPYHQWTYDLEGRLLKAARMDQTFEPQNYSLRAVRVQTVAGCIYVSLSEEAPDFGPFREKLEPALGSQNLVEGKLAYSIVLEENANWKLVMENARECYHCLVRHPELMRVFPREIGDLPTYVGDQTGCEFVPDQHLLDQSGRVEIQEWWQIARFPFNPGVESFSMDGHPLVKKPFTAERSIGSLRWASEPNNFAHATRDVAFMFAAHPTGPTTTRVTAKWLVHKDAVEGVDYDLDKLIYVWDQTNRQDRDLAENNQRGVTGFGYQPGPYSKAGEPYLVNFTEWYCRTALDYIKQVSGTSAMPLI
jgi:Rieske 2Fe-2S family protein